MQHLEKYDDQNIMAKIISKEIPNHTVYEDEDVLSFMDIMPQTKGHTLIVTKKPTVCLLDADPEDLAIVMKKVQKIAQAIQKALNPSGILLRQSTGESSGQTIFHLHFHLIPTYDGEKMKHHASETADHGELAELAKQINQAI